MIARCDLRSCKFRHELPDIEGAVVSPAPVNEPVAKFGRSAEQIYRISRIVTKLLQFAGRKNMRDTSSVMRPAASLPG